MISSVTLPFTFVETKTMRANTESEPITAAMERAISPKYPKRLKATPPMAPDKSTTKATPKLAPALTPNTEGSASGLRKTVCI